MKALLFGVLWKLKSFDFHHLCRENCFVSAKRGIYFYNQKCAKCKRKGKLNLVATKGREERQRVDHPLKS